MDPRRALGAPEFVLEVFADPACVKDVVRGALTDLPNPTAEESY